METMSPASPTSIGARSRPRKARIFETRPGLDRLAVAGEHLDRLVRLHRARGDAPGDDAAEEGVRLEQRPEHPERTLLDAGLGHVLQNEVEERGEALRLVAVRRGRHPAGAAGAVEDREVKLLVGGVQRREQVEDLVDDLARPRVRAVDLVDRDDGAEPDLERLRDHEFRLRHRPLSRVHQDDDAVDHGQDALDLAAEVGVAGGVDDVDAGVLPDDRGRLGQDGDAALLLEVVRVHRPLLDPLILAEGAGLLEQLVDERGLAVVDVGDDGDVAQLHLRCPKRGARERAAGGSVPSPEKRCSGGCIAIEPEGRRGKKRDESDPRSGLERK